MVVELVDKVIRVLDTVSLVVWVEGDGQAERVVSSDNFKLMNDVNFESGRLSWL